MHFYGIVFSRVDGRHTAERTRLIHTELSMDTSTADILTALKVRCVRVGINFEKFRWIGFEQAPDFDPNDPEVVVVLDITLDTLFDTFCFAWRWIAAGPVKVVWHDNLRRYSRDMRLREGSEPFEPYTLRWRRIKLDTHLNIPANLVDPAKAPGVALLFVVAQHPERIKVAMNGGKTIAWVASAIQCQTSIWVNSRRGWNGVPRITACKVIGTNIIWLNQIPEWDHYHNHNAPTYLD